MDLQIFIDLQERLDQETALFEDIKDAVKELNKTCRLASAKMTKVHGVSQSNSHKVIDSTKPQIAEIKQKIETLAKLIKPTTFYKYKDMWSMSIQSACGLVIFIVYLEEARLATPEDIQMYLGQKVIVDNSDITEFVITLDEYLHGVISLFSELSRLAVNSVILNDVQRPKAISDFASDLYAGFQLLNLKNDSLRRRFDSIKYDIKKIEEVQYDLRVRGLTA
ncbi:Translin-1 [Coemansia sp. Benny D115]|nr:Translin-1 [Coemansia sp. Benny D115]